MIEYAKGIGLRGNVFKYRNYGNDPITSFRGDYNFLSNMCNSTITVNDLTYSCVESAFQSFKTKNMDIRQEFTKLNGVQARKLGRELELREDW